MIPLYLFIFNIQVNKMSENFNSSIPNQRFPLRNIKKNQNVKIFFKKMIDERTPERDPKF